MATPARGLEVRTRVVTQTITRPSATITTVVTLGDSPASTSTTPDPTPTPSPPPDPTPTPAPTTIAVSPAPAGTIPPLTTEQLIALLASLFSITFLVLLICCYLTWRRRREAQLRRERRYYRYRQRTLYGEDEEDDDDDDGGGRTRGTAAWNLRGGRVGVAGGMTGTWTTVPPPVRIPPTPRVAGYKQTREVQMPGMRRFP